MDEVLRKEVHCPKCQALLFKIWNIKGDIEIKCRKCKKIVLIKN